jgi:putative endopeptidase
MPSRTALAIRLVSFLLTVGSASARTQDSSRAQPAHTPCTACQDFFRYVNGAWLDTAKVPAANTFAGTGRVIYDHNQALLRATLEDVARGHVSDGPGAADTRKAGVFYASCMDSVRANREGAAPIADELARIAGVTSSAAIGGELARLQRQGVPAAFTPLVLPDFKNASRYLAALTQGGLGLPDPSIYLAPDSSAARVLAFYHDHIARSLALLGESSTLADSEAVAAIRIEVALARVTVAPQRDPDAVYHKMSVDSLARLAPGVDWHRYFLVLGASRLESVNVMEPAFMAGVAQLVTTAPTADWRAYLRWKLVDAASGMLGTPYVAERFAFQSRITGVRELPALSLRCLQRTDGALGEAVGRAYVKRAFSSRARARALELVQNLHTVLRERLTTLDWMSDSTRREALAKLDAMRARIGYPSQWRSYATLDVKPGAFYLNVARANAFELQRTLRRAGQPVDRAEWGTNPQTLEAFYSPFGNEIVFPAGILQPPLFDVDADDAANYGAIGSVIGHELTHGFDDSGRRFDARGNIRDWWTTGDAEHFRQSARRVSAQYAAYRVFDDDTLLVNPTLTLGENIADIGGVRLAYAAFERASRGKPARVVGGLTPEQRFFVAYALAYRAKLRPEIARLQAATDPHGPAHWRVNGPLVNMPEFARAFGCRNGDPMVRADSVRVTIW